MTMPDEIELLRAEDMCIGPFQQGECGCLVYWTRKTIPGQSNRIDFRDCMIGVFGICSTNWRHEGRVTRQDAADMFNHTLHLMGYTENNPPLSEERIAEIRRRMGVYHA